MRRFLLPPVRQLSTDAGEVVTKAAGSVQDLAVTGSKQVRRWGADAGAAAAQIGDTAHVMGAHGSQTVQQWATDPQEHDKLLLGIASVALTAALSIKWLRRA